MTGRAVARPAPPRRLRLGMVGGGQESFIGPVHRMAARLDDRFVLVAGALSSDPDRARASGADLRLAPERCYVDFATMATEEAARADGIDAVSIVTPNHLHFAAAKAFLEAGIHVICDKPLVHQIVEADTLADLARQKGLVFVVTYNYSGYPMVRQARAMVAAGALGTVRLIQVEYLQDWLTEPVERTGRKQAVWRTDPARSGIAGALGDIGSHAFHLAEYVSGLRCTSVAADLATLVPGRQLDDNAHVLMRYASGARGLLSASQVAPGNANALRLRVYGTAGGLEWHQEEPERLSFTRTARPPEILRRGGSGSDAAADQATRLPAGHPEGYLEAFAQIYRDAADLILATIEGRTPGSTTPAVPTVEDGVRGVRFIHAAVRSSQNDAAWVSLDAE